MRTRGSDVSKLADFVHVPDPGKDTFIYVIDRGVNLMVQNVSSCCDG